MSDGFAVISGPENTINFRLRALKIGLKSELRGVRLTPTRTPWPSKILREQYGFTGTKAEILAELTAELDAGVYRPLLALNQRGA